MIQLRHVMTVRQRRKEGRAEREQTIIFMLKKQIAVLYSEE